MNMIRAAFICSAWVIHAAASHAQADHPSYRIYDTREKKEVTLAALVQSLGPIDIVFFGEEHNDSVAHVLQFELLKAMDEQYDGVGLSMEMFVSDDQLVLDEYLSGLITERSFNQDATLWGNYKDYRPMVEHAKKEGIPVLAANAPSRYTNRVTRSGLESLSALDKSAKRLLAPLPIDTLTGRYYEKFSELMGGHEGMDNMKIYQSQSLWDATMAYRISKFFKGRNVHKVLHINGRFHSDEHLGTVAQLSNYLPQRTTVANISCFPAENFSKPDWDTLAHLGDFIILTNPAVSKTN